MGLLGFNGIPRDVRAGREDLSALVLGWLRSTFSQAPQHSFVFTLFNPTFIPHMAAFFPRWGFNDPSCLFLYVDEVTFRPHHFSVGPANRTIIDNAGISQQEFAYLVACPSSVLIYKSG